MDLMMVSFTPRYFFWSKAIKEFLTKHNKGVVELDWPKSFGDAIPLERV